MAGREKEEHCDKPVQLFVLAEASSGRVLVRDHREHVSNHTLRISDWERNERYFLLSPVNEVWAVHTDCNVNAGGSALRLGRVLPQVYRPEWAELRASVWWNDYGLLTHHSRKNTSLLVPWASWPSEMPSRHEVFSLANRLTQGGMPLAEGTLRELANALKRGAVSFRDERGKTVLHIAVEKVWRVWCGVVWCGVVSCGVMLCGVVWCGVVWRGVVWCDGHEEEAR